MAAFIEKRKFPRVKYPCKIKLHDADRDKSFLSETENISCGGLCTSLPEELDVYSPILIEIDLKDKEPPIKCTARVVWCLKRIAADVKTGQVYDMGIEFLDLKETDRKRIDQIVQAYMS